MLKKVEALSLMLVFFAWWIWILPYLFIYSVRIAKKNQFDTYKLSRKTSIWCMLLRKKVPPQQQCQMILSSIGFVSALAWVAGCSLLFWFVFCGSGSVYVSWCWFQFFWCRIFMFLVLNPLLYLRGCLPLWSQGVWWISLAGAL